jgi:hypothetical protein
MTIGSRVLHASLTAFFSLVHLIVYCALAVAMLLLLVRSVPELLLPATRSLLLPLGITLEAENVSLRFEPLRLQVGGLELSTSEGLRFSASNLEAQALPDAGTNGGMLDSPVEIRVDGLRMTLPGDHPLTLDAGKATVRAEPGRFREQGRLLSKIELDRLEVDLVLPEEGGGEPFDPRTVPPRLLDLLPADSLILRDGRFKVRRGTLEGVGQEVELALSATPQGWSGWTRARLLVETAGVATGAARMHVTAQGTAAGIACAVEFAEGSLSVGSGSGEGRWAAEGPFEGRGTVSIGQEGVIVEEGLLASRAVALELPQRDLRLEFPLQLRVSRAGAGSSHATGVDLKAGTVLELSGTLSDLFGPAFSAELTGRVPESATLLEQLRSLLPQEVAGLSLQGEIPLRLDVGNTIVLGLAPRELEVALPGWGRGRMTGMLRVKEPLERPVVLGSLRLSALSLRHDPLAFSRATVEAEISGPLDGPSIPSFLLKIPDGGLTLHGEVLPSGAVTARGRAELGREIGVPGMTISAASLGKADIALNVGRANVTGSFDTSALPLAAIAACLPDAAMRNQISQWSPEGRISVDGRFSLEAKGAAVTMNGAMAGLGLASPDGTIVALDGGGRFTLGVRENGPVRLDLRLDRGEVLVDTVYLDLKNAPVRLSGSGVLDGTTGVRSVSVQGELKPYFGFELREGTLGRQRESWRYSGNLSLKEMDLGTVYATFLRDPLSAARPSMQHLAVAGKGMAGVEFSGTGALVDIRGSMRLIGASLSDGRDAPLVEALDLDLPLAYRFGGRPDDMTQAESPPTKGFLTIRAVHTPAGTFTDLNLPISLVPNRLIVQGDLFFPLYDGGLRVEGLVVDDPLSADFTARTRAYLERIDLSRIEGGYRLQGSIEGDLGPVTLDRTGLRAEGRLAGSLFGGHLVMSDLMVMDPLGLSRAMGADLSVRRMDLSGFSESMGFGLITGRMDLDLHDLRIAYGQAVGFKLRAESVPVKGEPQKVSLAAVNAISVVGTGASLTSTAISLFKPFVQEFAYSKIGILCVLTNDVFRVNGLIKEGGVEYLVRKPLLFGINVVNRNPDNRISFKDMLERINRVLPEENRGNG